MSGYSLTYIYHDCFMLETAEAVIIFDYWKDPLSKGKNKDFPPLLEEINPEKQIYILVSHHHKDHFTRRVFLWQKVFPKLIYIISEDTFKSIKYLLKEGSTYRGPKPLQESVHVLKAGETYRNDIVSIRAFASTDIGNSYALEIGEKRFFHAGDLNAWLWLDESSEDEIESARNAYEKIISEIRNEYQRFDLVMFPVDSRLGRDFWWGAKYFVNHIFTDLFVPMHFELVLSEDEKEQRRIDAAAFNLFARSDYGAYLQLGSTRSRYISN